MEENMEQTELNRKRLQARLMGLNMVVVRSAGRVVSTHMTSLPDLKTFAKVRGLTGDMTYETIKKAV